MARNFIAKWVLSGRNSKISRELDYARSEYPFAAGSGYAACSANPNLLLSVPSNKVFHLRSLFYVVNDSIVAKIAAFAGGSAASLGTTQLVLAEGAAVQSGYMNHIKDLEGVFVYSASQATVLFLSTPVSVYARVGGRLYDYVDFE